jgi:hypothetical protein
MTHGMELLQATCYETRVLMNLEKALPPKLDSEIKRLQLVIGKKLFLRIDAWRRRQPPPMPNTSEALRQMAERVLDQDGIPDDAAKPKPKRAK